MTFLWLKAIEMCGDPSAYVLHLCSPSMPLTSTEHGRADLDTVHFGDTVRAHMPTRVQYNKHRNNSNHNNN